MTLANVSIYYKSNKTKSAYTNNKFNISATTWNDEFNLPDGHILFQTFKIILNTSLKKHETITDNPPVQIYANKIKTGYKLELISPKTMK